MLANKPVCRGNALLERALFKYGLLHFRSGCRAVWSPLMELCCGWAGSAQEGRAAESLGRRLLSVRPAQARS